MNLQVCGPRQPPTVQETLQIQRFHAECCKMQVLGPYHGGGRGGGGSEPRTGIIYDISHSESATMLCAACFSGVNSQDPEASEMTMRRGKIPM